MNYKEKPHLRRRIYKGRSINFSSDVVKLPDGKTSVREYTEHPGAVAVLALLQGGKKVVFVRQHRWPVHMDTIEVPAGKLAAGENPLFCAKRELEEETGFRAERMRKILTYWPSAGFSTEVLRLYLASGLKKGKCSPDADEFIEPVVMDTDRALKLVKTGCIRDAKTVIALLFYANFLLRAGQRRRVRKVTKKKP